MNDNEVQSLLAWSVNGTLDPEEQAAVAEHCLGSPSCREDLASTLLLAEVCRQSVPEEPAFDARLIDRAIAQLPDVPQLPRERDPVVTEPIPETPTTAPVVSLGSRLRRAVRWSETPTFARLAIAAQVALVVGLTALVGVRLGDDPNADAFYDTVAGPTVAADATVVWKETADSGEVAKLLQAVDAQIVDGPNTLGMYRLRFSGDASVNDRLRALKASELVLYAELAPQ